jgi:murein L,D-transpeptidase YafK
MVHGKCKSAGCYAMTDALIEEIYALAREQFIAGHDSFQVHAFPFRMTPENMARYRKHRWYPFWAALKDGYDYFEATRQPPNVAVCERRYLVNVQFAGNSASRVDPEGRCPPFQRQRVVPFQPPRREQVAEMRVMAPGVKMRNVASADTTTSSTASGMFSALLRQPAVTLGFSSPSGE